METATTIAQTAGTLGGVGFLALMAGFAVETWVKRRRHRRTYPGWRQGAS